MKLHDLLAFRGHHSELLPTARGNATMVYLTGSETENTAYWQLDDYVVSSRMGQQIVLVPKQPKANPNAGAAQAYPTGRWTGGGK